MNVSASVIVAVAGMERLAVWAVWFTAATVVPDATAAPPSLTAAPTATPVSSGHEMEAEPLVSAQPFSVIGACTAVEVTATAVEAAVTCWDRGLDVLGPLAGSPR